MKSGVSGSKRLWVVALVVVGVGVGVWASSRRGASGPSSVTLADGRPKLLEFGMGICEQCKRMKPVMARARLELGTQVDVEELDIRVPANAQVGERLGLRVIPTVMLLDGAGKTTWRHEGFIPFADLAAQVDARLRASRPSEEARRD